ncbi:MAG: 50S ribosomal protein L3 N(5)-glutamine methyltransferase [Betaproteobacteria bacterium]|nr:MAG: 50S ribosomal protein L3 N(5)-glutamine methyltransferase [Betaproteobacteria bacterium]
MTLAELIERTAARFAAASLFYGHGTDNPRDEAAWLVLRALGLAFDADLERAASAADAERIERLAARRIDERMPLAYLLKEAWLAGQWFYVDERVIVPRSHIAELVREPFIARRAVRRVLDLCTGSGCLAILAARAFPAAEVDAVDISPAALAVARKNVAHHRVGRRVHLRRSDLFAALGTARYDLILANPPYVSAPAMEALPAEYRHEPRVALAGGADGLAFVARILAAASRRLEPDGLLICEVGDARRAVERRFARLQLAWPKPEVLTFQSAKTPSARRRPASRAAGAR